jgi:cyclic pyranopterin phosphate synthase
MPQRGRLTHIDEAGAARMVDVGQKPDTQREAVAECRVRMSADTLRAVRDAEVAKGDTLAVARVAGIMAAKRTPDLIPLCHPLPISSLQVDFDLEADAIRITATARVSGQTGVEMEALTAAGVAGLTVIDMVKGLEKGVWIEGLRLLRKSGGKSGDWQRPSS